MNEYLNILEKSNELIRSGQQSKAQTLLASLDAKKIIQHDRVYYCELLRRCGAHQTAIKILQPLIYPKARSLEVATHEEKIEYAACLVRIGVLGEAQKILESLNTDNYPLALIRLGFIAISQWNYQKANEYFLKYLNLKTNDSYQILVAKVNLLQGYVLVEEFAQAQRLITDLTKELKTTNYKLLLAAVYEFASEKERLLNNFNQSLKLAHSGLLLISNQNSLDAFLLEKQIAVITAYKNKNISPLLEAKKKALKLSHFESLRDLDLHIGILSKNSHLLNQLYWRTLSKSYQERIIKICQKNKIIINTFEFKFKKNLGQRINLRDLSISSHKSLRPQQHLKVLQLLLSENYKPIQLHDIFSYVFNNEVYIPESSENKCYQLIYRLKQFIIKQKWPIEIICKNKRYSLNISKPITLINSPQITKPWLTDLSESINSRYFTLKEVIKLWNTSERTAIRRLNYLKKQNLLITKGNSRARKFKLAQTPTKTRLS